MAVVIDGTTGISTPAEAVAGNLSYTGTLTGGAGVINLGSGQVYKDASGNLGIGTASPSGTSKLEVYTGAGAINGIAARLNASSFPIAFGVANSNAFPYLGINTTQVSGADGQTYNLSGFASRLDGSGAGGGFRFFTAPSGTAGNPITFTQAMTLDSSGNLLVGTTSAPTGSTGGSGFVVESVGRRTLKVATTTTGGAGLAEFINPNGVVGTISVSGSTTTYGTSSDYRLKEAIAPMTGALARVAALRPCTYKWKVDGSDGQGFIAHELAEVEAGCVTGEKDAVDADGNPQYQGIDTSFLIATLSAAIQELHALVKTQAERITALEGAAA